MKGLFGLYVCVIAFLLSCSKSGGTVEDNNGGGSHNNDPLDSIAPVLVVNTPTTNQVFTSGNAISVTGNVSDEVGLYRGSIRITDDANGNTLKLQQYEIHFVPSYNFNVSYTASVTAPSDYTVTVSFEDHNFHITTKTVKIKVNP